ncbi:hypothetical protein ACHMW7_16045 [Aminobacter sp. UC22_36]|uniref:hypothetical protein n=1 Tax=Aminobacter sp. UC22_36 TaxID=3374549 RepID=UPI003756AFC8
MNAPFVRGASLQAEPPSRELYRPTLTEERIAIETMLRSDISQELRRVLHDRERELVARED